MINENIDILITRAVDGQASQADWAALESLAQREPGVWRDLAMAQRDHQLLSAAVGRAVGVAGSVEVPSLSEAGVEPPGARAMFLRTRTVATWGGWAAAAAVALAFVANRAGQNQPPQMAGAGPAITTAADALSRYLDQGKQEGTVIGEVPGRVLVDTSKAPDGNGYTVIYLRQIVERTHVPDLYKISSDEAGFPSPVRIV